MLQFILASTIYQVRENEYLYVIWVALSFLCEGGHFSCFPPAVAKIFGIENGGIISAFVAFAIPVSSLSSFAIVEAGLSPQIIFIVAACLTASNMLLLLKFDDSEIKEENKYQQIEL